MNPYQEQTPVRMTGEITRVRFANPESGFAVVTLRDSDRREFTLCGNLGSVMPGQFLEAEGVFSTHPEFGRQLKVTVFRPVLPSTPAGIGKFLSSSVPGIGPHTAKLIVDHFGADTLKILDKYPKRLTEVPGIGRTRAERIASTWSGRSAERESLIYLQGLGITPAYCNRLFKRYGAAAAETVRSNPYRLAEEVDGIGFLRADQIARNMGFDPRSVERLTAATVYTLNNMIGNGHVCAPAEVLLQETSALAQVEPSLIQSGLDRAIERRLLYQDDGMIYTPLLYRAEKQLPLLVAHLASARNYAGARLRPRAAELKLAPEQQQAVDSLRLRPLCIITGGPGVGKTTVVGEIVRRAQAARLRVALAAPTGRAAKRLGEATKLEAKTLHRLLLYDPGTNSFKYNREHPLECDLLIVDEVSMLDIVIARELFEAIRPGCSVVLVGDSDQLPSVGPGNVLADFIASGFFAVTRLTQVFRQAAGSRIIANAHRVNRGLMPELPPAGAPLGDFYWIEQEDPARVLDLIGRMVAQRIPERFHLDPVNDIQVLSPMNRGNCGTVALNEYLGNLLNGDENTPGFYCGERLFKEGDKVMQCVNNYDKGVFNGDFGTLEMVINSKRRFSVRFDDRRSVEYSFDEAGEISRAYAVTVHKSQGCEFPAVVLPLLNQHFMMLQRNLVYTAMTRAKKLLVLIGSRKALEMAVRNARIEPRYGRLAARFRKIHDNLV